MIPDRREASDIRIAKTPLQAAYFVMELKAKIFKQAAERMRHSVFVEELGWVTPQKNQREFDSYDAASMHLGLFRNHEIIGHLRLTRRPHTFMLEKEFASLLPAGISPEPGPETAEISRLCLAAKYRSQRILWHGRWVFPGEILYHCLWKWCQTAGVILLYFVTTPPIARLLRMRGFPCVSLANPDPTLGAVACRVDWREYANPHGGRKYRQASKPFFNGQGHGVTTVHRI